jgi:hypothetical protein
MPSLAALATPKGSGCKYFSQRANIAYKSSADELVLN